MSFTAENTRSHSTERRQDKFDCRLRSWREIYHVAVLSVICSVNKNLNWSVSLIIYIYLCLYITTEDSHK